MTGFSSEGEGPYTTGVAFWLWLSCVFGVAGIHRFYLGKPLSGFLYLITFGLFGVGQIYDLIHIPKLVEQANAKALAAAGSQPKALRSGTSSSVEEVRMTLLREASKRGGKLTITDGVMASGKSFAQVEAILDEMAQSGLVGIGNDPDTGAMIYTFDELS